MKTNKNISLFGVFKDKEVHCISLKNKKGTRLKVLTLGATWHALEIGDQHNRMHDIVVAPITLEGYLEQFDCRAYYFGNSIGRYAGRIAQGKFKLNQVVYSLANSDGVHLHGGPNGLHMKIWELKEGHYGENPYVILRCKSAHLEEGFPGNLEAEVFYGLTENDEVEIRYSATSDIDTVLNLTNHTYLNLGSSSVLTSNLQVCASSILETDEKLIPTGDFLCLKDSNYDFSSANSLQQITSVRGLDNCYVLDKKAGVPMAKLYSPETGLTMSLKTNQPGLVIFAPEELKFAETPKMECWQNMSYPAICFEPQNFPDAPNHAHFPSAILKKGEKYSNEMKFNFSRIVTTHEKN